MSETHNESLGEIILHHVTNDLSHKFLDLHLFGYESIIFALAISYVFYLKRIIESFRKMEIKFSSWAMVEVPQLQPILLLIY